MWVSYPVIRRFGNVNKESIVMKFRFVCLFPVFIAALLQVVVLHGQIGLRNVSCGAAVVEFDNAEMEELSLEVFIIGADDTLIFAEDFSRFPSVQRGAMICNAAQLLRLPNSYTLYPNCRAKRLYSPNGDTCFFNTDGAFSTPYLDLSKHGNQVRLSYFLKSEHSRACTFSVYLVDEAGNRSLLQSIALPKNAFRIVDTVFNKPCNGFRLEFTTTGFVAFDDLKVSSSDIITTCMRSLSTTADSCVLNMLKADTRYGCSIAGRTDTLLFRTSKAVETGAVSNISPHSVDISVSCCDNLSNPRYVLKRLSDENTVYATDLFFSQVSSADAYNRALEIYNGTGMDICLEDYRVVTDIHAGGGNYNSTVILGFTARDTIKHDSCIVILQALHAMENNVNGVFYVNPSVLGQVVIDGNDPIALIKGNDTIDIFGNFGESISNQQGWTDEETRTAKTVLQRRSWVTKGVKTNVQSGFPTLASQWQQLGNLSTNRAEDFADFGKHEMDGALHGLCTDSVIVNFNPDDGILSPEGLQSNTTYELYLLAEVSGEEVRSSSVVFKTGKVTRRTQSGNWFDEYWTEGIPTETDEAVLCNPQTLCINQGDTALCYHLFIKDTTGAEKAEFLNNGVLSSRTGVSVDMNFGKEPQREVSYGLFGFPINVNLANRDSLSAILSSETALETIGLPQSEEFSQTQSYAMKIHSDAMLSFTGELNNEQSYSLLASGMSGLENSALQTIFTYNPYPFTVCVNQLLRDEVSLPQVVDKKTGIFVPLNERDSLQPFEGFLVEKMSNSANLVLHRMPLSPLPPNDNEALSLILNTSDYSDKATLEFSIAANQAFDPLTDNHKFSMDDNKAMIAFECNGEKYSFKTMPLFEDSIALDFEINLPRLDVYSLVLKNDSMNSYLLAELTDKESGTRLFDFVQDSVYTFQSPQATKHLRLKLYKTLPSFDETLQLSNVRLFRDGDWVILECEEEIEYMELYDMRGRIADSVRGKKKIRLPDAGIFVLKAMSRTGEYTWKLVNAN